MSSASSVTAASSVLTSGAGSAAGHVEKIMLSDSSGHVALRVTENGVAIAGLCWFDCGQPATQNMGTVRYPKLVCVPSVACSRAMQNHINAADKPEVKKTYRTMVRTSPGQYKNMIRSASISGSPPQRTPGVSTLAARDAQLSLHRQRIVTEVPQYRALQHQGHSVKHSYSWLDCRHINPMCCMC